MNSGLVPARLQVDATPTTIQINDISEKKSGSHFVFTSVEQTDNTIEMLDYLKQQNVLNGFSVAEIPLTQAQNEIQKENLFTRWVHKTFDEFTCWVHETFGEAPRGISEQKDRQQLVGVTLSEKPSSDKPIVLNVNFKNGDQSIRMDPSATRFEFNQNNWNKQALMLVLVDSKLKEQTTTTFEGLSGNIPLAWLIVFAVLSVFFFIVAIYHQYILPKPNSDKPVKNVSAKTIVSEFLDTFRSFFIKKNVLVAILFMLLYRLPEAQLVKLINPFMLDPIDKGGLGLTTGNVGFVYGTVGIIGLTIGGILGGIVVARGGLKKWLWPMVCAITLPDLVYVYLSYVQPASLLTVNICVFIEQFGYGFGFTAYMLYLIYFSEGEHKTSHYAICTGFMALGMMLPGMMAGWLQETIGYRHFFVWTIICCLATFIVCMFIKIDPEFGKKRIEK